MGPEARQKGKSWQTLGRLSYTSVPYSKLQQGTERGSNSDELEVNVHLTTLQLRVQAPTDTQLELQLPAGRLGTRTFQSERVDTGVGDMELRLRQSLPWAGRLPRIEVAAGLVLPTGPYVEKSGAANLPPEASFLTLGRGVRWWLLEVQASMAPTASTSTFLQLSTRAPIGKTEDDFKWGAEARAAVGAQIMLRSGLSAIAVGELQWRGGASEPDPFFAGRVETVNAGGRWLTLTPALSYAATRNLSLAGGVRIPVHADVTGKQLVPSVGGFVSLTVSWSKLATGQSRVTRASLPVIEPGAITIVDYWASWCEPCGVIDVALQEAKSDWPDVKVVRVDASEWPNDGLELPNGATGLPVVEIYDSKGVRSQVLHGDDALNVVDIVNQLRKNGG